jgi:hypothetical protein
MRDAYYFSHDSNAKNDPNILKLRSVYGWQGYGWYWAFVEMMREQQEYRLSMEGQYVWDAFAMLLQCDRIAVQKYVQDCINEFQLFKSDGEYFWSESLRRRMVKVEEKSVKARASAEARWKKVGDANAMRSGCERNAIKEKESKEKKNIYGDHVLLTDKEYSALVAKYGQEGSSGRIAILDNGIAIHGYKYKSHYAVLREGNWVDVEYKKRHPAPGEPSSNLNKPGSNLMDITDDLEALKRMKERRAQLGR